MIDWWDLAHNALWIVGLAMGLAVVSVAGYEAGRAKQRLRDKLAEPGFQSTASAGLALFCAGLLLGAQSWWERGVWGVLAPLFAAQAAWLWWQTRAEKRAAQPRPPRPRLSRRTRIAGCALILAGGLVLTAVLVITAVQGLHHARSLQGHLQALETAAGGSLADLDTASVKAAGTHLAAMHDDLLALEGLAAPFLPLCRYLGWVPTYGGDLASAPDLLDVAVGTSAAGDRVFRALSPAVDALSGPDGELALSLEASAQALPVLAAARPELEEARSELSAVRQAREQIDTERLSSRVAGLLARLDRYLPLFESAVDGALVAPALLGADGPRTYLVIAQNNHELRATGGFISGVGELHIEGGRIISLSFSDSYAVDNFEVPHDLTPADLHATLWGELWLFRDGNWDPDFPTSARRLLDIYARDRGVQAEGVFALDLTALRLFVGAVGPVEIEGLATPVTGGNVVGIIQEMWGETKDEEEWREWWQHRKDFMGEIAAAVLERVRTGEGLEPANLVRVMQKALEEKHVLAYVNDPDVATLLRRQNWDGAVAADLANGLAGDSLFVVDSNVGFNKMDPNVARTISYRVDLGAADGPRARLTLTYRNQSTRPLESCVQEARYGDGYADMMERCYWDYVRVYVPGSSQLASGPDVPLPPGSLLARFGDPTGVQPPASILEESGKSVWTEFFALQPSRQKRLVFDYELPTSVVGIRRDGSRHYRLLVQKQPGTEAIPLELTVILPPGADLVQAMPGSLQLSSTSSLAISTTLRTDQVFEVVYTEGVPEP